MNFDLDAISATVVKAGRIQDLKRKISNAKATLRHQPTYILPKSTPLCEGIGSLVGMQGFEVEYLLSALIQMEKESIDIQPIKDMLIMAKLCCTDAMTQIESTKSNAQVQYDAAMTRFDSVKTACATNLLQLETIELDANIVDVRESWASVINTIHNDLQERGMLIANVQAQNQEFLGILIASSKYIRVGDNGEIEANWEHVREKFHLEHILGIMRKWIRFQEEQKGITNA